MDALNKMIIANIEQGLIHGIPILGEEIDYVHNMYADDTTILIEVDMEVINNTIRIFKDFGDVSRLYVKWKGMATVLLSPLPLPTDLQHLD